MNCSQVLLFHFTFTVLIVSQTSEHYKDLPEEIILITLDAQKAFDKSQHEILFNKIYHDGITENM
jgi:hypothetical protein